MKPTKAADEGDFVRIGEIYGNCNSVSQLYAAITGKTNATYDDVVANATKTANVTNFQKYNDKQWIKVTFGGKEWYAVYLSQTNETNPRPILTLWLCDAFTTAKWNYATYLESYYAYPMDMYSISYVRTQILNNAGQYSTDNGKTLTNTVVPDSNHILSRFSIPTVQDTLTGLIVKPTLVEWQRVGQNASQYYTYNLKNENWGEEPNNGWSTSSFENESNQQSNNYSDFIEYGVWANDFLWLPSVTELHTVWQWGVFSSVIEYNSSNFWTRSGAANYHMCSGLFADFSKNNMVYSEREIRPALHLDLQALNAVRTAEHNYGDWSTTTPATCTTDGEQHRICEGCGHEDIAVVPATGHNYTANFNPSTGKTTYSCTICHEENLAMTHDCTDPQGHNFLPENDKVVDPKCEENGYTIHICEHCQYTYHNTFTPATGHSYGAWVTVEPATTDAAGVQKRICEHCGAEQTRSIAPLAGTTGNKEKDNNSQLLWGIIIGIIAVLAGCGGLAWILLTVLKPRRHKKNDVAAA